jgi:Xaa-Pro aminopeptidase
MATQTLSITPDELATRVTHTRALLRSKSAAALIAYATGDGLADVRYLIGCKPWTIGISDAGEPQYALVILAADDTPVIVSDSGATACDREMRADRELSSGVAKVLAEHGLRSGRVATTGILDSHRTRQEGLAELLPDIDFFDGRELMDSQRATKSAAEVELLRAAAHAADRAVRAGIEALRPGVTARGVATAIMRSGTAAGADCVSEARVLHGPRIDRSTPGHEPPTALSRGELVYIEASGWYEGYGFANSRVAVVGRPSQEQADFLEHAVAATEWMIEQLTTRGTREFVLTESRGRTITPGGNGLGLQTYEAPWLAAGRPFTLRQGMVINVRPVVTSRKLGSISIQDTVLISDAGAVPLNTYSRRTW